MLGAAILIGSSLANYSGGWPTTRSTIIHHIIWLQHATLFLDGGPHYKWHTGKTNLFCKFIRRAKYYSLRRHRGRWTSTIDDSTASAMASNMQIAHQQYIGDAVPLEYRWVRTTTTKTGQRPACPVTGWANELWHRSLDDATVVVTPIGSHCRIQARSLVSTANMTLALHC